MSCPDITPTTPSECGDAQGRIPIVTYVCRTEDDKAELLKQLNEKGLSAEYYEIKVDPDLYEALKKANSPIIPDRLYDLPEVGMRDMTGWNKQMDRMEFNRRKEQNKWRNKYFNRRQR